MRFRNKVMASLLTVGALCLTFSWYNCKGSHPPSEPKDVDLSSLSGLNMGGGLRQPNQIMDHEDSSIMDIECVINDDYTENCKRDGDEIFMPFSFIAKYFEVYGKISENKGVEVFDFHHSYSKVYFPSGKYSPDGIFMSFEHYNVEVRDRVKCISGIEGVPISTQWGAHGYFYPIQIAQYGLSHYSKYLVDKSRTVTILEDGENDVKDTWAVLSRRDSIDCVYDDDTQSHVIEFDTAASAKDLGVSLNVTKSTNEFFLSFDIKFINNGSIMVAVEAKGKHQPQYYIRYVLSKTLITSDGANTIIYGIGDRSRWSRITRDIATDFQKGLAFMNNKKKGKSKISIHRILNINFIGKGMVDNVTLSSNAHLAQFYYAANWLVLHQDHQGGWPINVERKLANGQLMLPPGWYSAMAQGQAMSLLVRAYIRTKNRKYLISASKALNIYKLSSEEGGVFTRFANKYDWYEEYPTTPSSFVLNGFIYSLLGLYDLKMAATEVSEAREADELYQRGLESLKAMLPLFDTGSGSIYDLRHFTLGTAPNLARWDYHTTHINQLLLLATVDEDPIFDTTARRWIGYMKGKRAPHN